MLAALVALALAGVPQDDRDPDPTRLPGEADRYYRLGDWERAGRLMRDEVTREPSNRNRTGLIHVLYRARRYAECSAECDRLTAAKEADARAFAFAMKAACALRLDDREAARNLCEAAIRTADGESRNAFPAVRRLVREVKGLLAWTRFESRHFVVFAPPDSPVAAGSDRFLAGLEDELDRIARAFELKPDAFRIEAVYFSDLPQGDEILGVPPSFSIPREQAYYALVGAPASHEIAHIVSFHAAASKGKDRPRSALLVEGLAASLTSDPLWERRMAEVPVALLRQERLPRLSEGFADGGTGMESSAVAGSFVRWLVRREGREKWARLWTEYNDPPDPWTAVYGRSLKALDEAWRSSLKP